MSCWSTQSDQKEMMIMGNGNNYKNNNPPWPPATAAKRASAVRYTECLKNHAAAIGGNAMDGCGEFMPGGEQGTIDALRCSACGCHRNFHRKEAECDCPTSGYYYAASHSPPETADRDTNIVRPEKAIVRKRFRTKFTAEQKEKMRSFAERAGWRIQKVEESEVERVCQEIGIKRRVLKVWMHNNKHNFANKLHSSIST